MALKIVRQKDAATLLRPEGWIWSTVDGLIGGAEGPKLHRGAWEWAYLKMVDTTDSEIQKNLKALVEMLHKFHVTARPKKLSRNGRYETIGIVSVKPIDADAEISLNIRAESDRLAMLSGAFGDRLNIRGWSLGETDIPVGVHAFNGATLYCASCGMLSINLLIVGNKYLCRRCVRTCPGDGLGSCDVPIPNTDRLSRGCPKHFPRVSCSICGKENEQWNMGEHRGSAACQNCLATICTRCNTPGTFNPSSDSGYRVSAREWYQTCKSCTKEVIEWLSGDPNERIVLEKPCKLLMPSTSTRPTRLVSVELEVSSGAQDIVSDLCAGGLTRTAVLHPHWQGDMGGDFCYMEKDGSLADGGGELIFSKMRLDDAMTAEKFSEAVKILRKHVRAGNAAVDLTTGCHIHVDAHKMGFNHVRNLAILHNYLEDVLYRLGAANYARHRGTMYATVLPKTGLTTQEDFNSRFFRGTPTEMHHSVLNVAYFYRAVQNGCACGSIYEGNPESCTCNLGKCTVEFRVFNGTSSWKKLHAYTALCLALVAYATKYDYLFEGDLPPALYNPVGRIDGDIKGTWKDRLTWMFRNLYFTTEERESLSYCVEHSELAQLTYAERRELRQVEYSPGEYVPTKAPKKATKKMASATKRNRTYLSQYTGYIREREGVIFPPVQWVNDDATEGGF